MAWNAQWTGAQWLNMLPSGPLEDLRLALKERSDAAGASMPTGWGASFTTGNQLPTADMFAAFQAAMTALLDYYIDHTTSWEGTTSEPTIWTSSTISALTTATTRLPAPTSGYLIPRPWLVQQYELLNLLRWIRIYKFDTPQPPAWRSPSETGLQLGAGAATWADAKTAFKARTWTSSGGRYNTLTAHFMDFSFNISGNSYQLGITEAIAQSLQYSAEAYWKESGGYVFEALGPQDQEGKWNLLHTLPEGNGNRNFDLISEATFETAIDAFTEPDWHMRGSYSHANDCILVAKFDGANGFTYKDW